MQNVEYQLPRMSLQLLTLSEKAHEQCSNREFGGYTESQTGQKVHFRPSGGLPRGHLRDSSDSFFSAAQCIAKEGGLFAAGGSGPAVMCCHEHDYRRDDGQGDQECSGLPQRLGGATYHCSDTIGQPHICREWQPPL